MRQGLTLVRNVFMRQTYLNIIKNLHDSKSTQYKTLLILILFVGFFLRLLSLTAGEAYHTFAINDEIVVLDAVMKLLAGEGKSWYLGPSMFSSGNAPGTLWTLFVIAMYKLGLNSIWGALFVMVAINSITIYLVHKISICFLSPAYALFTTLLFATAPWVIFYSVGLYNPMPTAFLASLLFISLWNTLNCNKSKYILFVCIISAALPQFHMVSIFYLPFILFLLLITKTKVNKTYLFLGILIGVSFYIPYIIGDALSGWENTKLILAGEDKIFSFSVLKIISAPITVLSNAPTDWIGREIDGFKGYQSYGNYAFGSYYLLLMVNLTVMIFYGYILFAFIRTFYSKVKAQVLNSNFTFNENPKILFLGSLVVLPLVVFLLTGRNYSTRYAILIFPLLFLLPGYIIARIKNKKLSTKIIRILFLVSIFNVYLIVSFYQYQNFLLKTSPAFMPSLNRLVDIKKHIDSSSNNDENIEISLSNAILILPEEQQKLYRTIIDFMHVYTNVPTQELSSNKIRNLLVVRGNEDISKYRSSDFIYKSPVINIVENY